MYPPNSALRDNLTRAHQQSWQAIGQPGSFLTAKQRVDIVRIARESLDCHLCADRKDALSPNAISGEHHCTSETFDPTVVDFIHRVRTDPGRITHHLFKTVTQAISTAEYVELVGVLNTAVIIDTLHNAIGLGWPALPKAGHGEPVRISNPNVVDDGAWVPILDVGVNETAETGLPRVPNIARSLGLVPGALELFFNTFRPHYALQDIPLSISQAQAEFVASRVSAINECFY